MPARGGRGYRALGGSATAAEDGWQTSSTSWSTTEDAASTYKPPRQAGSGYEISDQITVAPTLTPEH